MSSGFIPPSCWTGYCSIGRWCPGFRSFLGSLVVDGHTILLSDLTGILHVSTFPPPLKLVDLSPQDRDYVIKETNAAWIAFLNALPCAVVNRPVPGGRPTILAGSPLRTSDWLRNMDFCFRLLSARQVGTMPLSSSRPGASGRYLKPLGSCELGMLLQPQDGVEQLCRIMEQQAI